MKNNSDDKEITKIFYDLYYICMKYNDENKLSKNDKKEINCDIYLHGFKFFAEKYINDKNRNI
jgi:hypothetical protein